MDVPKQLQDKLAQFQGVQNQLQMVLAQKQQLMLAASDTDNALTELGKAGDGKVYKMAGTLLIESTKDESMTDLSQAKETAEARIKVLETQEKKLRSKFEGMRKDISEMLGGGHSHAGSDDHSHEHPKGG